MSVPIRSPLPPPPLTVRPVGLLDFLSIQAGGRYPQHLLENLQPTFDLAWWFLDAQAETLTSAALAQTGSGSAAVGFTVPSGEAWLVESYTVMGTVGAGITRFITNVCTFDTDGVNVRHILATSPPYVAADAMAWAYIPDNPQLWLPGTPIGLYCTVSAAVPGTTPTLRLRMVRCTV